MSAWTKMAYGSLVATGLLVGGVVVCHNHADRPASSVITAEQASQLFDAVLEKTAAASWSEWLNDLPGGAPFSTNSSTLAGWGTTTNLPDARRWQFYRRGYTGRSSPFSTIPLIGSSLPRRSVMETLDNVKSLVPRYVDRVEGTNVYYLSVTGVWARLGIGDHTNKWTVGVDSTTNHYPVYGTNGGSTLSTSTLNEAWAVLNVCTTTVARLPWIVSSNSMAKVFYSTNFWPLYDNQDVDGVGSPPDPYPEPLWNYMWRDGNSVLSEGWVSDLTTYSLSELPSLSAPAWGGSIAGSGGEVCSYSTDFVAQYDRFMWYDIFEGFYRVWMHDTVGLSFGSPPSNPFRDKINFSKVYEYWGGPLASFPSGVEVKVTSVYSVTGNWSVGVVPSWVTNYPHTIYGPNTNYVIGGVITQEQTLVFDGQLSTDLSTNVLRVVISPALTNYVPSELLDYHLPFFYQDKTSFGDYEWGWYSGEALQRPVTATYETEDGTGIVGLPPSVGGSVHGIFGETPLSIFNWTFIHK